MTLNDLQELAHNVSMDKGWYDQPRNIGEMLALIHSEISEALEEYRNHSMITRLEGNKPVGFPSELADAVIRIADLAEFLQINLTDEIIRKMAYNKTRPYRHGGKVA